MRRITESDVFNAVEMVGEIVTQNGGNNHLFLRDVVNHSKGIYIYRKAENFNLKLIKHAVFDSKRDLYDVLCTFHRVMLCAGTENNVEALINAIIVKDNRIIED